MATIPSGRKFFSQAESVNTTYSGPAALKVESAWYTIEDIAASVGAAPVLNFTWSKGELYYSERIDGSVYTLGISINNLTLDPSKTYKLLIKRWRYTQFKEYDGDIEANIYRTAGYKHETDDSASENNRANKIPIVTTDLTYYDFNQDFYFKEIIEGESYGNESVYATGTGRKQKGASKKRGWVSLAFDLEITNEDDTKTIIENVGKISMISNVSDFGDGTFNRTISYNKMT